MIVVPISGCRVLNSNMTAILVEQAKSIYLIDAGKGFEQIPSKVRRVTPQYLSRIQPITPNFQILDPYLLSGYSVRGVILTHIHNDHLGGIEQMWKFLKSRGQSPLTYSGMVTGRLARALVGSKNWPQSTITLQDNKLLVTPQGCRILPIALNHSVMGTIGFLFKADGKKLLYLPDFCLDYDPIIGPNQRDIDRRLHLIGKEGIDILVCQSTVASMDFQQIPSTERQVCARIVNHLGYHHDYQGIIVSGWGTSGTRVKAVIEKACEMGRQVLLIGRNLTKLTDQYFNLGIIEPSCRSKVRRVRDLSQAGKLKRKYLILTTGHQGQYSAGLPRMLRGQLPYPWGSKDVVLILSKTIPRPSCTISRSFLLNQMVARRIKFFQNIHKSGHVTGLGLVRVLGCLRNPGLLLANHGDQHQMVGW